MLFFVQKVKSIRVMIKNNVLKQTKTKGRLKIETKAQSNGD